MRLSRSQPLPNGYPQRMLRTVKRAVVLSFVLLLAWSLLPGSVELTENAWHLTVHGDLAHDQARQGHLPFNPEHGCGGGFHLCSCCHVQSSQYESAAFVDSSAHSGAAFGLARFSSLPQDFFPQLEEPPRA